MEIDHCTSAHETTLIWPVMAFSETTTLIFFVWPETVATERMVAWPEAGLPWVTVTVAVVELAAETVYPPLENCVPARSS